MRVAILGLATFDEMAGGSARYISGLAPALDAAGHDVMVFTSAGVVGAPGYSRPGVLGQLRRALLRIAVVMPRSALAIARFRPDVLNVHFALDGLVAVVAGALMRVPIVVNFQGPWADEAIAATRGRWRIGTALRRAIESFVYHRATRLIVLSRSFRDVLVSTYGVDPRRIRVIPAGIAAPPPLIDREEARSRLGLRDDPVVVTVRRLVPRMGLDLAIDAIASLADIHPVLLVAGTGPERQALEDRAGSLGVGERVRFLGRVPDEELRLLYAAGDLCVVPSRALEGFGYVALEALAAGTPVIASATGGLAELVGDFEPRWLAPPDSQALAGRIRALLDCPDDYPDREACRRYAARFDWSTIAAEITGVFIEARSNRD